MANYSHPTSLAWEKWLLSLYPRSQAWGPLLQLMSQAQVLVQQTKQGKVTSCRPSQGKSKQPMMPYFLFLDEKILPLNTVSMQIAGHKNSYMFWYLVHPWQRASVRYMDQGHPHRPYIALRPSIGPEAMVKEAHEGQANSPTWRSRHIKNIQSRCIWTIV